MSNLTDNFFVERSKGEGLAESLMASFSDMGGDEGKVLPMKEPFLPIEEVPLYRADPHAFLPSNAEPLIGSVDVITMVSEEIQQLIEEELIEISKHMRNIAFIEEKIWRNNALIEKNLEEIRRHAADIVYQRKNRDYWFQRELQVLLDYQKVAGSCREIDWAWLIKKYGLKEGCGVLVDYRDPRASSLCEKAMTNLMMEYKEAGNKHDQILKSKELERSPLERVNQKLSQANEELNAHVANIFASEIAFIQEGVSLLRDLSGKLGILKNQERKAVFGDIRSWAESYLDQFLRKNPLIPYRIVSAFRRLTSIPLPAQNS